MKIFLTLAALAASVLLLVSAAVHAGRALAPSAPSPSLAHCVEDDPCWNCSTMGNHICGVQR